MTARLLKLLALAALLAVPPSGCRGLADLGAPDGRIRVVCTTGQVGDMLENIGGSHVDVRTLMGPGVDPHLYKAAPADIRLLKGAKVVFYNGLHLEGRLAEVLEKLAQRKPTYAVVEEIKNNAPERLRKAPQFPASYDPHIWFDVALWADCADYAARKLIEVDPLHAEDYRRNADAYIAKLRALDNESRALLAEIPRRQRVMITAHDAFAYFGRAYDVEVHGLQGISTADEADLGAINELVRLLVDRNVKAVFIETSVPSKNIRSLIQGCEATGHRLVLGGELYSDAMGPPGTPQGTYIGMIQYNVHQVVKALQ
ncbi:MAG: zinc ABC transporter substrate-binding protein [Planctomycetia bacterium]|nr:zinc ABC transporter substrate-binding protein [Planctomycetia bacterium]